MKEIKRIYEAVIEEHFSENRQMLFLVGPRQVGKITTSLEVTEPYKYHYYFQNLLNADYALQVVLEMEYVDMNCFQSPHPIAVPAKTFLSQLV